MQEIWKDIEGYEGLYQVSNYGKVRNTKQLLKGWVTRGYHYINLNKDGIKKSYRVHRLVAKAFISNPNNLPCVNHIDENKLNNRADNLEWCTQEENVCKYHSSRQEQYKNKRKNKNKIKNYHSKTRVNQYDLDGNFIKTWESMMQVERTLNIKSGNISLCCRNIKPTAKGYIWRYANK